MENSQASFWQPRNVCAEVVRSDTDKAQRAKTQPAIDRHRALLWKFRTVFRRLCRGSSERPSDECLGPRAYGLIESRGVTGSWVVLAPGSACKACEGCSLLVWLRAVAWSAVPYRCGTSCSTLCRQAAVSSSVVCGCMARGQQRCSQGRSLRTSGLIA